MRLYFITTILVVFSANITLKAQMDIEKWKNEIIKTDKDFNNYALKHGTKEAFIKFGEENSIMLSEGQQPIFGLKAVAESLGNGNGVLTWEPEFADVAKSGDLGYSWGKYIYKYKDNTGKELESFGKYVSIWKRQKDESWKWVLDIGNSNPKP